MKKADNNKKQSYSEYLKKLIRTAGIFEDYTEGKLSKENEKLIEAWDPEGSTEYYKGDEELLAEARKQVKENLFASIGIPHPEKKEKTTVRLPLFRKYASIAAILLIAILSGVYLQTYFSDNNNIMAMNGSKDLLCLTDHTGSREIQLPDGSLLHVNRNSRISYNKQEYNLNKREIWIEEGEVFFDVAKHPDKPFIIHSGGLQTVVKGTSFNVKAYKEIKETEVSVRSGKVEVLCGDKTIGMLTANQKVSYNKESGQYSEESVNWQDAAAWMDNRLVLKQAGIDELKLRIKQIYDIDLLVVGGILDENHFNASYPKAAKIENVLQNISEVYEVKYKFENSHKVIIYQ